MAKEHIITGIDIGSRYIYTVVASVSGDTPLPKVIGIGRSRSAGIRKGMIIDPEGASGAIKASVKEAEKASGEAIKEAFISIGGDHIESMPSRGVVAISRADGEITDDDVERVRTAAATVTLPQNREILHNIPKEYIVDKEEGLRDVVGMRGLRLEANTLIVAGSTAHIKNLTRCVNEADVDVDGFVLAPIAAAQAVLSNRQKELGVLCLDIGAGTTNMSVFEEGNLIHANTIPLGGDNITNDLAIGLRINVDVAERIKREYGMALVSEASKGNAIDLSQYDPNEKDTVSRKELIEIMEARLYEIFELVNKELREIGKEAFLPGGVVLTGGCAKIPHIVDMCKMKLRLPVQIGFPRDVDTISASIDDPSYATSLGLIFYGFEEGEYDSMKFSFPNLPKFSNREGGNGRIKRWLRTLLP
ncbi:MAG: cell division protein FtsA [Candidatus Spechtbacterales bacterium]|nr:cell division protein FtsA [Candidatus Spechtbacterales bacterium]